VYLVHKGTQPSGRYITTATLGMQYNSHALNLRASGFLDKHVLCGMENSSVRKLCDKAKLVHVGCNYVIMP
jgi:hypothetical protein